MTTTTSTPEGLPNLPVPFGLFCGTTYNPPKEREFFGIVTGDVPEQKCDIFTADQMQAYALAAIAALPQQAIPKGMALVPVKATREMLNAAIDVDSFKLGDISPLGFRCSPQQLFEKCFAAMLASAPLPPPQKNPGFGSCSSMTFESDCIVNGQPVKAGTVLHFQQKNPDHLDSGATCRVPKEPTVEMTRAAAPWLKHIHLMRATDRTNAIHDAYKAMISAATTGEGV